jgi:hypothetical protein
VPAGTVGSGSETGMQLWATGSSAWHVSCDGTGIGRTSGDLFVFAVAANGRILFNQIEPGGVWVGVQEIPGGFVTNAPVAAGMQGNTLFVFAKDAAGSCTSRRHPRAEPSPPGRQCRAR